MLKNGFILLLGSVFFTSTTILASQVLLARETRVAFGFGLEFIIFSFAIAGIGLGGLVTYFLTRKHPEYNAERILPKLLGLLIPATVVPLYLLHIVNLFADPNLTTLLDLLFFLSALIFYFLGGAVLSLILKRYAQSISLLYFMDLIGGAFGAVVVVFLMDGWGTESAALATGGTATLAVILYLAYRKFQLYWIILPLALVAIGAFLRPETNFQVTCRPDQNSALEKSNSFSQINIDPIGYLNDATSREVIGTSYRPGVSNFGLYNLSRDCKPSPAYILKFKNLTDVKFLLQSINNLPYLLRQGGKTLEIGSGPGNWVIIGALNHVPDITAVEINPLAIDSFDKVVDYNIYQDPSVNTQIIEGRNFLARTNKSYDLIFLFTSVYGGIGTTAYSFSENYLYTEEAYASYLNHLSDHGILAVASANEVHWLKVAPVISVLRGRGLDPKEHLLIANGRNYSLALTSKDGFTMSERHRFVALSAALGYTAHFINDDDIKSAVSYFAPVTDDRPFLLNTPDLLKTIGNRTVSFNLDHAHGSSNEESGVIFNYLLGLLGISLLSYLLLAILPYKLGGVGLTANAAYLMAFFTLVSLGFITFELSLVQKLALFLERPQWSISVALAGILIFGGIGALLTRRTKPEVIRRRLTTVVLALIVTTLPYLMVFDLLFANFAGLAAPFKILITLGILAIPSLLVGMVFPLGLLITRAISVDLIPWVWGIDGVTAVLGGVLAKLSFLTFGFRFELTTSLLFYAAALLAARQIKVGKR